MTAALGAPLLGAALLRPRWREGLGERLGRHPGEGAAGAVWVHGASVGEIRAATALVDALLERGLGVVASTTSLTGRALLRRTRPDVPCGLAPLDHPWCAAAALRRVAPRALVLVETELWPSWIAAAARRGVPTLVVSGRISERSFPRYRRAAPLLRPTLRRLAAVGARSAADAERFVALGADRARVELTGDLKLEPSRDAAALAPDLAAALGGVPLLVAGSTHPGEEEVALAVLRAALGRGEALALLLAPRYPDRADAVVALCAREGFTVRRRSRLGTERLAAGEVLVLDTLGELGGAYRHARLAFVGGSLAPVGGHNLLEPLQAGCPVLFGPHVQNASEAAGLLEATGAGERVADADALVERALAALADPDAGCARVARGLAALDAHRGSTRRTLALIERVLGASGARRVADA